MKKNGSVFFDNDRGQENNYWAAIFLVPGGAATIMNVKTKVTENITLLWSVSQSE